MTVLRSDRSTLAYGAVRDTAFQDVHVRSGKFGSMIISLLMNITMNQLGGASVIAIFTTRRSHGYVNTTTWLGISQFFLFLAPNFNILTTENRSICNRDLN